MVEGRLKFAIKKSAKKFTILVTFSILAVFISKEQAKKRLRYTMNNQQHKRQWRELDDATRERISRSTQGKRKTEQHKQRISQSMKDYWQQVPHRPQSGITMADLIGANTTYQGGEIGYFTPLYNNLNKNEL